MNRLILITLLILFSTTNIVAQENKTSYSIDNTKPTIFITFERYCEEEPFPDKGIMLRLHNNSQSAIKIDTASNYLLRLINSKAERIKLKDGSTTFGLINGMEIEPLYLVEQQPTKEIQDIKQAFSPNISGCIVGNSWLASGNSIVFRVAPFYLESPYCIYLQFDYEWESRGQKRVYFYPYQLPEFNTSANKK